MVQDTNQKLEYHPEGLDSAPSHNRFHLLREGNKHLLFNWNMVGLDMRSNSNVQQILNEALANFIQLKFSKDLSQMTSKLYNLKYSAIFSFH